MRLLGKAAAAAAAVGAYACYEPYRFRLVRRDVGIPRDVPELEILHISDTHFRSRSVRLVEWLERLPGELQRTPDLVIATGDLIQDNGGIDLVARVIAPLKGTLGSFYVLGSHDYYQSGKPNYSKYFKGEEGGAKAPRADTARLEEHLQEQGWVALTNTSTVVESPWGGLRLAGVDDPYLKRHRLEHIERRPEDALAIGLMHSPDVLRTWVEHDFDLVLAGHTHGGQVRIPGVGAIVTNSTLPRRLAKGLHQIGGTWLHVSPGLGQGKFSPIRFNCPPEATLLRIFSSGDSSQTASMRIPSETMA